MRLALIAALAACNSSEVSPLFPSDYALTYVEVRPCRPSGDHDLNNVRIVVDAAAADAYRLRDRPFASGAIVVKEEYEFSDDTCTGALRGWTAMMRVDDGESPATLDWRWQRVSEDRRVTTEDEPRCYGCHQACGRPPDGYLGTCSIP